MQTTQFEADEVAAAVGVSVGNVSLLGTGSFGETWRVDEAGSSGAYKILYRDGYMPELLAREVEGLSRVQHDGVVKLLEHGELTIAGNRRSFLRFEYVPGGDLAECLAKYDDFTSGEIDGLLHGLLTAVEAMHLVGVLHRDIKPGNIALRDGRLNAPVLLDLGLAKSFDAESLTVYPNHIGSPPYMAPEQLEGKPAQTFSDLWSIGVVVAEAAIGEHPYFSVAEEIRIEDAIERQRIMPALPSNVSEVSRRIITKLLSVKTYRRGTATSALRDFV